MKRCTCVQENTEREENRRMKVYILKQETMPSKVLEIRKMTKEQFPSSLGEFSSQEYPRG